jgi:hypothetical protein
MGLRHLPYRGLAERYPHRRPRLLHYWRHTHAHALKRYRHYQHQQAQQFAAAAASPVAVIERIFGSAAPAAISVATCESGLDPNAHNPSGAAGLFQLMPIWWEAQGYDPYDPVTNTTIAYHIYTSSGWSAWVCQP